LGAANPVAAAALLVAYPAWDALANAADARRNGGARANPTQALNAVVSGALSVAVLVALGQGMHAVLALFGIWAGLAGVFQLLTGHPPLEEPGRAMGDGPQRRAIGARRRLLPQAGERRGDADDPRHRALCRVRRLLLPRLGAVAGGAGTPVGERTRGRPQGLPHAPGHG
jgi:hypothetical protein